MPAFSFPTAGAAGCFTHILSSVLVTQSRLTLCDPMDCSLPGSSVHGILQVRILEWVAIPFPGDLPDPRITPRTPAWQADSELLGKPLQYSCLENPRDSRAWWAAVVGVAQSRTRLKRVSSSRRREAM